MQQPHSWRAKVVLAVACLSATACAAPPDPAAGSGAVRVGVVAPREQGPRGQVVGLGYLTAALVHETLVSIGANGALQPGGLIERWERSEDGRRWRFHLRNDVKFHDGQQLTSSLVVPIIRRELSAFSGAASIEPAGDMAFDIVQERASGFLLDGLAGIDIGLGEGASIGTGPFTASRPVEGRLEFSAFGAHHGGTPSVPRVGLQQYDDQRNAWAALMRGEIDVLYEVSPDAREFVETETTVNVSAFVRPYTYLLGFNLGHEKFKQPDVRRALNLAVDRAEVIRTALKGHAEPAYDHLWPGHWAVDPARSRYAPDRPAALRLLETSGLTSLRPAGTGRMPSRLAFTCLVYAPLEKFALAIQRQLAMIDVDMAVELLPAPELGRRLYTGDFEAFLFELANARVLGYTYNFWHSKSPGSVRTGYGAADAALDRMRYARTEQEVRAAVRAVQDAMREDPPAIFIAYPEVARAVSRRFEIPAGQADIFHTIARWTPAPKAAN